MKKPEPRRYSADLHCSAGAQVFLCQSGCGPSGPATQLCNRGNADQLRSFTINFLIFGAIHGGVLPFLNRIFGAR
ncbi:hypothetical protein, partial [Acinetobacter sp.]|uniref:hypothetical protein n=2 Tax=Acinetobacter sp. TaxID=472 RepID=UPI002FC7DF82